MPEETIIREVEFIDTAMAEEINKAVQFRQSHFEESLYNSVMVVLLNFGDHRRIARCISGDWSGPKSELNTHPSGLPICPVCGRACTEEPLTWRLGLVKEERGDDPWGITKP